MAVRHLNHFNGADGATTFTDEVAGVTWSRPTGTGSQLDTAFKQFGSASLLLPDTGSPNVARGSGFSSPHAGNYTWEFWHRGSSEGGDTIVARLSSSSGNSVTISWAVFSTTVEAKFFDSGGSNFLTLSGSISTGAFRHVAIVRDDGAGTYSFYADGSRLATGSSTTDVRSFDRIEYEFADQSSQGNFSHFDESRLTDVVQYSGTTYTVPTQEFSPDVQGPLASTLQNVTLAAAGTVWPTLDADFALSLSGLVGSPQQLFDADFALSLSGVIAPAVQGLGATFTLTLSTAADLYRQIPSSMSADRVLGPPSSDIIGERSVVEIVGERVRAGAEITAEVDA